MNLDQATIDAVFAAAATARWTRMNLGHRADVRHQDAIYTVVIPLNGQDLAEIVYQERYGMVEYVTGALANLVQHMIVVDRAVQDYRVL